MLKETNYAGELGHACGGLHVIDGQAQSEHQVAGVPFHLSRHEELRAEYGSEKTY